ncbi:hypothetical protein [Segetibacter koreensis]|nr:hypothetical protein [Segetibacter koreensis]
MINKYGNKNREKNTLIFSFITGEKDAKDHFHQRLIVLFTVEVAIFVLA